MDNNLEPTQETRIELITIDDYVFYITYCESPVTSDFILNLISDSTEDDCVNFVK
jgi:hypothetical protein